MTLKTGEAKQQLAKASKSLGDFAEERTALQAELATVREQLGSMTERFNELAAVHEEHESSDESNKVCVGEPGKGEQEGSS